MGTLTKRILSMALALCLCLAMLPTVATQVAAADPISMMVSWAQERVGKSGQQLGYNDEWCAYFVSDCAAYADQSKAIPYNGNAHYLYFAVLDVGGKVVSSPQAGDLVFYNCTACDDTGDGISMMHVGLVENENYSIEGNLDGSSYSTRIAKRKGLNERYSHSSGHSTDNYVKRVYVRPNYTGGTSHTCNKGTYVYYEAAHPHYKCYECSICGNVWRNTEEPTIIDSCSDCVQPKTIDDRYSSFFPIASYPLSSGHINVYDVAGNQLSNRYIDGATDICIIWEVYTDGWCKVRYPSTAEESGYFDAYVPFSTFTESTYPSWWTTPTDYTTYMRSDLSATMHSVSSGKDCMLLITSGSVKQIIHPVDGQSYSMMGWISDGKQIHVSESSLELMLGGTESQVINAWSTGSYDGNTALYFSRSNSNISCSWGDWTDGKAPLTVTANSIGTTTLTIGVKDSDSGTVLDSTTVTVTVTAKTYTISYNANGGSGAPGSQTKYHNTTLALSSTKPTRSGYKFVGWSASSSATSATYQPGGSFTSNSDTTLYAVWEKGCESNSHSYSYKVTKTPTTSATGTLTGTCSKCSGTTTVTLPKLNTTDYSYNVIKDATCTAAGTGRYTWKTTTYGSFYFDVAITRLGHSYSYKVTKTPTTSATGMLTGTCSKCSGTTTVTLPKLNTTDYTYKVIKEPSYTATGTGRYTWNTTKYGTFYFDVMLDKLTDSNAPQIVIENVTATAGETVSISVYLENNPGVAYAKFKVDYSDELTLVSAEDQSVLSGTFTTSKTVDVKPYVLQWMGADNSTENGCFVILTFYVAEDAEDGIYDITMICSEAYNAAYEDVTFAITNASVTVTSHIPGDVNDDGKVNGKDGVLLAQYLAEWNVTINMDAADVNGDGKVNGKDGILLAQYLAEWDVALG